MQFRTVPQIDGRVMLVAKTWTGASSRLWDYGITTADDAASKLDAVEAQGFAVDRDNHVYMPWPAP